MKMNKYRTVRGVTEKTDAASPRYGRFSCLIIDFVVYSFMVSNKLMSLLYQLKQERHEFPYQ